MQRFRLLLWSLFMAPLAAQEYHADIFVGWQGVQQNFKVNTNLSVAQKGIGLGGRFYIAANDMLYLGGEAGFSHIETHWDISGNITHLQFVLKYMPSDFLDIFGGLGVGARGAPADIAGSNNDWALFGGMADAGVGFVFGRDKWRVEAALYYYTFSGQIFNALNEEVTSLGLGIHMGKTIDLTD